MHAAWVLQTPVPHSLVYDSSDIHATVKPYASCHVQKMQGLDTGRFLQITVSEDQRPTVDSSWLRGGRLSGRRCYSTISPHLPLSCPLPHFLLYKEALVSSVQISQEGGKPSCPATNHRTLCGGHLVHQAKWSQRQPHSTETWQLAEENQVTGRFTV